MGTEARRAPIDQAVARIDAIERQLSERPTWADLRAVMFETRGLYKLAPEALAAFETRRIAASRSVATPADVNTGDIDHAESNRVNIAKPVATPCPDCAEEAHYHHSEPVAKAPDEPPCPVCGGYDRRTSSAYCALCGPRLFGIHGTQAKEQPSCQQDQSPSVASAAAPPGSTRESRSADASASVSRVSGGSGSSASSTSLDGLTSAGVQSTEPAPSSAAELRDAVAEWRDSSSHGFYTSTRIILGDRMAAAASRAVEEIRRLMCDNAAGHQRFRDMESIADGLRIRAEVAEADISDQIERARRWSAEKQAAEAERDEARRHAKAGYDAIAKAHQDGYMCHPAIVDWQQSFHKRAKHPDAAQGGGD